MVVSPCSHRDAADCRHVLVLEGPRGPAADAAGRRVRRRQPGRSTGRAPGPAPAGPRRRPRSGGLERLRHPLAGPRPTARVAGVVPTTGTATGATTTGTTATTTMTMTTTSAWCVPTPMTSTTMTTTRIVAMTTGATTETTAADAVTTARTTTEPSAPAGGLSGVSVRTRLITVVALLTGLALAAAGGLVYALESARIEDQVRAQVEQEIEEFRNLQQGVDPDTGRPFTSVATLIELFLRRNVPDDDEALVGFWDGRPGCRRSRRTRRTPRLLSSRASSRAPGPRRLRAARTRRSARWSSTVVPVSNAETTGALVVLNFMQDEYGELDQVLRTYFIVSALLLLIVTGVAAWQAGRLLAPLRTLRETAQEISETDLSRRIPETGNDDITALTRTVNQMLDRLERAFTGQRQFLDDAGHELQDAADRAAGAPRADGHRRPGRGRRDPRAAARRGGPDVAAGQRPDHARQDRPPGLLPVRAGRPGAVPRHRAGEVPRPRPPRLGARRERRSRRGPRRAADHPGAPAAGRRTRSSTPMPGTRSAWAPGSTPTTVCGCGCATPARASPTTPRRSIFDRFSRDRVRADDEGFGLGLSIVAAIARAHGGTARVDDAPGGGAVFTLVLPAHPEGRPMARILIVEDEQRIASFIAKGLTAEGHITVTVGDGVERARPRAQRRVRPDGPRHRAPPARRASTCSTSCAPRAAGCR